MRPIWNIEAEQQPRHFSCSRHLKFFLRMAPREKSSWLLGPGAEELANKMFFFGSTSPAELRFFFFQDWKKCDYSWEDLAHGIRL